MPQNMVMTVSKNDHSLMNMTLQIHWQKNDDQPSKNPYEYIGL